MAKGKKEVRFQHRPTGSNGNGTGNGNGNGAREGSESGSHGSSDGSLSEKRNPITKGILKEPVSRPMTPNQPCQYNNPLTDAFVQQARNARSRICQEETELHHKNDMDLYHDCRIFRLHIFGPHLYDNYCHRRTDSVLQRGHCHFKRP